MPKLEWMLIAEHAEFNDGKFTIRGAFSSAGVDGFPVRLESYVCAGMVRFERHELTEPFTQVRIELALRGESGHGKVLHEGFARLPDPAKMATHAGYLPVTANLPVIFFSEAGEYDVILTIKGMEVGRATLGFTEIAAPPEIYI